MVLKLYGNPMSTCTKRVAIVLHEKKVPFEFFPIDFAKGEHKSPEYTSKQPFGQVPYIDDDGFFLFESRAICRYLEEKYPNQGTSLIPSDFKAKMLFEQAASIEAFNFDFFAAQGVFEMIFKPKMGFGESDTAVFNGLMTSFDPKIQAYDKILSKQKYVAGDILTMADLFHLPYGVMLNMTGTDVLTKYPNVDRWFKELQTRPSWLAVKEGISSVASY